MSTFKVGEVAVLCNLNEVPKYNGQEVTIVGGLAQRKSLQEGCYIWCYEVDVLDFLGRPSIVAPHNLRKKRPPTTGEESILALFRQNQREGAAA